MSLHRYGYAQNSPANFVDPKGNISGLFVFRSAIYKARGISDDSGQLIDSTKDYVNKKRSEERGGICEFHKNRNYNNDVSGFNSGEGDGFQKAPPHMNLLHNDGKKYMREVASPDGFPLNASHEVISGGDSASYNGVHPSGEWRYLYLRNWKNSRSDFLQDFGHLAVDMVPGWVCTAEVVKVNNQVKRVKQKTKMTEERNEGFFDPGDQSAICIP